jgi:DNA repair ATPase RecN
MTDIPHAEATKLNGELFKEAEKAEILAMNLASVRATLSGSIEIARDYADENAGLSRELDRMRSELEALAGAVARTETLAKRLDELEDDSADLALALDDLQYVQGIQQDVATMALDVERGIRDPDELSRLVQDCAGLAR